MKIDSTSKLLCGLSSSVLLRAVTNSTVDIEWRLVHFLQKVILGERIVIGREQKGDLRNIVEKWLELISQIRYQDEVQYDY